MSVKVRLAPSPTGFLHVGTAQSGLYNWLFARKHSGKFYLRIEDTDRERSTKEYEQNIVESLTWLGLTWDGEITRSSSNQPRYQALLGKLLSEGKAFYCHHTQEELEAERKSQEAEKLPPRHVCGHKHSEKGREAGGIVRLAVDEASDRIISFDDELRGRVEFKQALLGDFSIGRSAADALYHFAVVVDDADMEITHVLRGEDHISNTPKQILIYEALGFPVPKFAHLPLLLAPDRSKLSKRHGATAVLDFKKDYLPEALVNFLGILGYTFNSELLTKEDMAKEFDLAKVHKSSAVFDIQKLNWLNSQYIKKLSSAEFKRVAELPHIPDAAVPIIIERLEKLSDTRDFAYLWEKPDYDAGLLKWKKADLSAAASALAAVRKILDAWQAEDADAEILLRNTLDSAATELGDRGLVYWPFRVALTGKEKSPDPVQVACAIGKGAALERVDAAIEKLRT
ncbi:MAG TPA: glutamate--tRNA ligase [Candidatus Paceibacterota bacterium]|nr:glutamate--tRNA ligase [Candidatus Paceibacterota bacterium]